MFKFQQEKPVNDGRVYVTIGGKKMAAFVIDDKLVTICQMAAQSGCTRRMIAKRLSDGMSPKEAMSVKTKHQKVPSIAKREDAMVESTHKAVERLRLEGRYIAFKKLRSTYRLRLGSKDSFYEALRFFPPLSVSQVERLERLKVNVKPDGPAQVDQGSDKTVRARIAIPGSVSGIHPVRPIARGCPEGGDGPDQACRSELGGDEQGGRSRQEDGEPSSREGA